MAKPLHYQGSYHVRARRVREQAAADPLTRCWRCDRTLDQHPKGARWTAGHLTDGEVGGMLLPEASTCNYSAGASAGNRKRTGTTATW